MWFAHHKQSQLNTTKYKIEYKVLFVIKYITNDKTNPIMYSKGINTNT